MNQSKFDDLFRFYKENYKKIEQEERYKWEAVYHFQHTWDIDAPNFLEMLIRALKKTKNLMDTGQYFPRRMIIWIAEKEPEITRNMFSKLYNTSVDLEDRIYAFKDTAIKVIEKHKEGNVSSHYQDERAIMVYLNLKYPEIYYLYKYQMFKDFVDLVDYDETLKRGSIENLFKFESLCNLILSKIHLDYELLELYEPRRKMYYDPEYHLLVQDIIYAAKYYTEPEWLESIDKKILEHSQFNLNAVNKPIILKGYKGIDYIYEAKRNKEVGDSGEAFIFRQEQAIVKTYCLPKSKEVRRVSILDGDGLGYDIRSYDKDGNEKYIEVKTTTGAIESSVFITANELEMSERFPGQYWLYRVYNFDMKSMQGDIAEKRGSLKDYCISAQSYKVDFK